MTKQNSRLLRSLCNSILLQSFRAFASSAIRRDFPRRLQVFAFSFSKLRPLAVELGGVSFHLLCLNMDSSIPIIIKITINKGII